MLKLPQDKPVASFCPCQECGNISTVHFPKGNGRRSNTPYLSCVKCGTVQKSGVKAYIIENHVTSLEEYATKYKVSVEDEQAQIEANKAVVNVSLMVRATGIGEEIKSEVKDSKTVTPDVTNEDVTKGVTLENETGEVVEDDKEDKPKQNADSGSVVLPVVLGVFALALVVGGVVYLAKAKAPVTPPVTNNEEGETDA